MLLLYARRCVRAPRYHSSTICRYFANTAQRATPATSPLPKSTPSARTSPAGARVDRIQFLAARILAAGRNELDKSPASKGYIIACLGISITSYGIIAYMYSARTWDPKETQRRELHWIVPFANQLVMVCWGIFAAFGFSRTIGLVQSIKLVKNGNKVLLETTVRRAIPFRQPEKIISEPHTLVINRAKLYGHAFPENMIVAPEGDSFMTRVMRTLFYSPFHYTRKAFGGVGMCDIKVGNPGSQRIIRLDVEGQFSEGGKDILEIAEDEL